VNMSVDDPFFAKYLFGAKVGYHLSEYFSLHASFATGPASPTGSTSICSAISGSASCRDALPQELAQVPGKIKMMGGAEVAFSPVYGKLNVLAEGVLHFDLSLMIGGDWISYQRVVAGDQAVSGLDPGDESTFGGHLGVGARIFLSRFIALRLEVKDYLYSVPIGNLSRNQLERQLFTELGLSFFFPTAYRAGP